MGKQPIFGKREVFGQEDDKSKAPTKVRDAEADDDVGSSVSQRRKSVTKRSAHSVFDGGEDELEETAMDMASIKRRAKIAKGARKTQAQVLQEQADKAEKEEKLNKEASSRLLDVTKAKREIMEPENQRQWINSPFSAYCAKPTKFDLWKQVPQTAPRFALLTKDFLESALVMCFGQSYIRLMAHMEKKGKAIDRALEANNLLIIVSGNRFNPHGLDITKRYSTVFDLFLSIRKEFGLGSGAPCFDFETGAPIDMKEMMNESAAQLEEDIKENEADILKRELANTEKIKRKSELVKKESWAEVMEIDREIKEADEILARCRKTVTKMKETRAHIKKAENVKSVQSTINPFARSASQGFGATMSADDMADFRLCQESVYNAIGAMVQRVDTLVTALCRIHSVEAPTIPDDEFSAGHVFRSVSNRSSSSGTPAAGSENEGLFPGAGPELGLTAAPKRAASPPISHEAADVKPPNDEERHHEPVVFEGPGDEHVDPTVVS